MADTLDNKPTDDVSALAWVHSELRRSLEQANKALRRYLKESELTARSDVDTLDPAALRLARTQLHQGVGALELVGLPAPARLLRAAESAVQRMLNRPVLVTEAAVHAVERASFALLDYLGRMLAGKRLSPVGLFPQYAAVQALAGADRVHPADLWEFDFEWRDLAPEAGMQPRAADEAARGTMEAIVLRLMRRADALAWNRLSELCAELAAGTHGHGATLWRLASAFGEAEAAGLLPQSDVHTKRVAARLLAQLRLSAKGQDEPSERLAQDLLFFCAHAHAEGRAHGQATPRLDAVHRAWQLDGGTPVDYENEHLGRFDPAWIALARKRVAGAKDVWSAVAGGELHRLAALPEQMALLADSVDRLFPAGPVLSQALQATATTVAASGETPPAPLAMEVATSVLYLDATLEDGELDQPDLEQRVRRLAQRIDDMRNGGEPQPLEPWMEELYRRVSDRQTMGSVVQELRASLSEIEKQIDQYFRDPQQRALLIPVPNQLSSMRGVLSVLGMDQASQAVLFMRDDVDALTATEVDPEQAAKAGTFDRLADNLGALSFLIDMMAVQPALAKSLFRFDAADGSLRAVMGQSERPSAFGDFDEAPLAEQARALADRVGSQAPAELAPAFEVLSQRALAADLPGVAGAISSAQRALARATDDETRQAVGAELAQTVGDLLPPPPVVAAPVPAPLPPSSTNLEDDAEMRDIFLEESREVIESARAALAVLADSPDDVAELTTVRRAFHTLKGSSRMVGLSDYGEAAWACEQLYNARLAQTPRLDRDLAGFSAEALDHLSAWTEAIAGGRAGGFHSGPLVAAADSLRLHNTRLPIGGAASNEGATPAAETPPDEAPAMPPILMDELPVLELPALLPEGEAPVDVRDYWLDRTAPLTPAELPGLPEVAELPDDFGALDAAALSEATPASGLAPTLSERVPDLPLAADLDFSPAPAQPPLEAPAFELDLGQGEADEQLAQFTLPPEALPPQALAPAVPDLADVVEVDFGDFDRLQAEVTAVPAPAELPPVEPAAAEVFELPAMAPVPEAPGLPELRVEPAALEDPLSLGEVTLPLNRLPADDETPAADPLPVFNFELLPTAPMAVAAEAPAEAEAAPEAASEAKPEPASLPAGPDAPDDPAAPAEDDEQVKVIGALRIPIPLFNIYLNEADELSRRLSTELAEWAIEYERRPVSEDSVVLAHSLAGSSATVGFAELSELARALEHALMRSAAQRHGDDGEPALFNEAADEIRRLLHQFAAGFLKPMTPGLLERLQAHERQLAERASHDDGMAVGLEDAWEAAAQTRPLPVLPDETSLTTMAAPLATASFGALEAAPEAAPLLHAARADAFDDDEDIEAVDALDEDLFPIFTEEAEELLPQLQARLREWALHPSDAEAPAACMRTLHTFKGGARLAGAMRLGDMAHRLETAIEHLAGAETIDAARVETLLGRADRMAAAYEALSKPGAAASTATPSPATPAATLATAQPVAVELPAEPAPAPFGEAANANAAVSADAASAQWPIDWSRFNDRRLEQPLAAERAASGPAAVRVRAGLLDRLVNQAGEVSITRARIDADVRQLQGAVSDLTDNLDRLRSQLRDIELQAESQITSRIEAAKASAQGFDPLEMDRFTRFQELTRMMAESVNDVATVQRSVQRTLQSTEDELAAQARLTRELQDDLLRTRMVEFESLADRLYRVVRQAAKDSGKQVRLDIVGGAIEVDRGVLERMVGPFEHLLRNSVAHGIETPAQRQASGKDGSGEIRVSVSQEGNEIGVECRDDGAGLDLERIRQRGIERGLIDADQAGSDAELANLIFLPGFSTAGQVTELAGRGVGLDVVRAEVSAMGGRIETASSRGQGTSFKLVLPLTTAVTQVVMLRYGDQQVAVPSTLVDVVRRVPTEQVDMAYRSGGLAVGEQVLPFFWLGGLLQHSARGPSLGRAQVAVVIRSAAQRVVLHVDEVLGNQEVVVKHVGPQLARLPGLAGVTLLPSGAVALIYNPVALAALFGDEAQRRAAVAATQLVPDGAAVAEEVAQAPLVLVVDDSLTVRRVTQRLLTREGYRVALAKDGMDAMDKLAEERPAIMLSDIEMPRMDGFDLVRNVRADSRLADLPVIMITSRIAQKHRDYAAELGVDHYLGKPYSEDELLRLVARLTGVDASAGVRH